MQKVISQPKTELRQIKNPQEDWKTWEKAWGIWKRKKIDPIKYLRKTRKEWERILQCLTNKKYQRFQKN